MTSNGPDNIESRRAGHNLISDAGDPRTLGPPPQQIHEGLNY